MSDGTKFYPCCFLNGPLEGEFLQVASEGNHIRKFVTYKELHGIEEFNALGSTAFIYDFVCLSPCGVFSIYQLVNSYEEN